MLYVNELYKTFADDNSTVNALQDINMHIKPNEFAVIVGPSGCGKTTLLNIAAGLETATRGNITLNGNAITGPGPDRGMFSVLHPFPLANGGGKCSFWSPATTSKSQGN